MTIRCFVAFVFTLLLAPMGLAQVPETIAYQGYLTDAEGTPIDDEAATLTFRLFEVASGGTALWTETQSEVSVDGGVFSATLGRVESLDPAAFDRPLWLSVAVGEASTPPLEPRVALAAVPYSLHAGSVAGLESYLRLDGSRPMTGMLDMAGQVITNVATATSSGEAIPFGQSATGDLAGAYPSPRVVALQSRDVAPTTPADGQVLAWSDGGSRWEPRDVPDGSSESFALPFADTVDASDAPAFEVRNTGSRSAANFVVDNNSNFNSAVLASTNGIGAAIFARTFGTGRAGLFRIDNNNNANPAVEAVSSSSQAGSVALLANHSGNQPDADVAIFQSQGTAVARIDKDGTGYFNGGTETNGADVAEAFDVEGTVGGYEPGDVLVISTRSDRRVMRTSEPYSPLVVGVYATKPGVLLTERGIDEGLGDQIPMGVLGVIPTKVSGENGPIRRGDLLVTASRPGHAMKGTDRSRMLGAVLGKALQDFDGPGTGVIQVMVTVR